MDGQVTATIEVAHIGAVPKHLKDGATVQVPPGSMIDMKTDRHVLVPQGGNTMVANMPVVGQCEC